MGLTGVTITGADEGIDPQVLAHLSRDYPFVEWGILFSPKRQGSPRYPGREWINRLYEPAARYGMNFAAHFCGTCTRDTLAGEESWLDSLPAFFGRVQLNGFESPAPNLLRIVVARKNCPEFILQVRNEAGLQETARTAAAIRLSGGAASALYDPSGGRGIEAFRWPRSPLGLRLGYAGGIKPSTVTDVLRDIGPVDHDFWIDMESGVRVDNQFSLLLVRDTLDRVAPFVATGSR